MCCLKGQSVAVCARSFRRAEPVGCSRPTAADQSTGGLDRRSTPSPWREQWLRRRRRLRRRAAPRRRSRHRSLINKKAGAMRRLFCFRVVPSLLPASCFLVLCRLHINRLAAHLILNGIHVCGKPRRGILVLHVRDDDPDRFLRFLRLTALGHLDHTLLRFQSLARAANRCRTILGELYAAGAMQCQCREASNDKLLIRHAMPNQTLPFATRVVAKGHAGTRTPVSICNGPFSAGDRPSRSLTAVRALRSPGSALFGLCENLGSATFGSCEPRSQATDFLARNVRFSLSSRTTEMSQPRYRARSSSMVTPPPDSPAASVSTR